jgi:hypothetical protein
MSSGDVCAIEVKVLNEHYIKSFQKHEDNCSKNKKSDALEFVPWLSPNNTASMTPQCHLTSNSVKSGQKMCNKNYFDKLNSLDPTSKTAFTKKVRVIVPAIGTIILESKGTGKNICY